VRKPEGRRLLGSPRDSCEHNIKMNLKDVGAWTGSRRLRIGTGKGHV